MATILGVTPRVEKFHADNGRKKFGASTLSQAVALTLSCFIKTGNGASTKRTPPRLHFHCVEALRTKRELWFTQAPCPAPDSRAPTLAYLEKLNPEQRQAVEHGAWEKGCAPGGPLLVIAGAGSGKTNASPIASRI